MIACATAHGVGTGLSIVELIEVVLDKGLPTRKERERLLEERLGDDNTVPPEPAG